MIIRIRGISLTCLDPKYLSSRSWQIGTRLPRGPCRGRIRLSRCLHLWGTVAQRLPLRRFLGLPRTWSTRRPTDWSLCNRSCPIWVFVGHCKLCPCHRTSRLSTRLGRRYSHQGSIKCRSHAFCCFSTLHHSSCLLYRKTFLFHDACHRACSLRTWSPPNTLQWQRQLGFWGGRLARFRWAQ